MLQGRSIIYFHFQLLIFYILKIIKFYDLKCDNYIYHNYLDLILFLYFIKNLKYFHITTYLLLKSIFWSRFWLFRACLWVVLFRNGALVWAFSSPCVFENIMIFLFVSAFSSFLSPSSFYMIIFFPFAPPLFSLYTWVTGWLGVEEYLLPCISVDIAPLSPGICDAKEKPSPFFLCMSLTGLHACAILFSSLICKNFTKIFLHAGHFSVIFFLMLVSPVNSWVFFEIMNFFFCHITEYSFYFTSSILFWAHSSRFLVFVFHI